MSRNPYASDAPTVVSSAHRPLRVAIDGVFEPRLVVSKLKLACDDDLSEATLQAYVGPVHATPSHPGFLALSVGQFMSGIAGQGLSPSQVVVVYRDGDGDDPDPQVVLRGFGDVQTYMERGAMHASDASGSIVVLSVLDRLNRLEKSQIAGRWVRDSASIDTWQAAEDPAVALGDDGDLIRIGRPCTFNARGQANRHPAPITVSVGGRSEQVYVFTDDDDPDAQTWTWAQALRYLLFFHVDWEAGLLASTNLWDQTRAYISQTIAGRPTPPVYEAFGYDGDPSTPSELLKYALLAIPQDAVFEGTPILEAMTIIARATDTHFRVQTWYEDGVVIDYLAWWARGGGARREVSKAPEGDTVSEVLESLNIGQMVLSADYRDVINKPIGLGDIRRHEVTVQLVPGWEPDDSVDRPTDVDAAIEASQAHWGSDSPEDDAWFQKYHRAGSKFAGYMDGETSVKGFANVGRRWVLNETGRYQASAFARATGYFVASKYSPWEPSDCSIVERAFINGSWTEATADWTRIPRPFQPCFSADADGRSLGVVVEASFDSGTRWEPIACKVLNTEAGIYIEIDNLTEIVSIYDDTMHWWKAMCQDKARVRVTAVIESDNAIEIIGTAAGSAIAHESARLYNWRDRIKCNYRTKANSIFRPGGERATEFQTLECRDDSPVMDSWIASLCDLNSGRRIPGTFVIPWLEFTRYQVGDCITQVRGAVLLEGGESGGVRRPPDIVAMIYSDTSTQIVLEDPGMAEVK